MTGRAPRKLRAARRRGLLGQPVLELGCGRGVHMAHLPTPSLGVDRSQAALDAVAALGQRTALRDLDRPGWSAGLGRWREVLAADLLVHLATPEVLLAELPEVLTDDGELLLVEWVWPPTGTARAGLVRALVPGAAAHQDHAEHLHRFTETDLRGLFARAGLAVRERYVHSAPAPWAGLLEGWWPPRSYRLGRA